MSRQLLDFENPHQELLERGWVLSPQGLTPGYWYYHKSGRKSWGKTAADAKGMQDQWGAHRIANEARDNPNGDMINSPPHYNRAGIEVIDVIEAYAPNNYHLGNVLKYVCRSGFKGTMIEDWKKARWYLDRLIALEERHDTDTVPAVPGVEGNP